MSTAIMHQSLYEFGELLMKNQSAATRQSSMNHINNNNNVSQAQQQLSQQQQIQNQSTTTTNTTNNSIMSATSMHNISVAVNNSYNNNSSLQQAQLTNNHKQLLRCYSQEQQLPHNTNNKQAQLTTAQLHHALARAHSSPQGNAPNSTQHISLMLNSLIENLGGHRRLERTQSEPAPQLLKAQAAQAALAQINTSRYKTELCRPFEEAGTCKYGDKCQFAHGMQELRNLQRHPKYKTELCRTFHTVGFCPYGPRCHFVHNAEEARNHNRAVAAYHAAQAAAAAQHQSRPAPLSLSPTFSMSTGSDRTSPSGSLSQSPTGSMTSFFNNAEDLHSPALQQHFATSLPGVAPTRFGFAPVKADPSPPATGNNSPPAPLSPRDSPQPLSGLDEARLPVFNRLSSTIGAFHDLVI